MSRHGGTKATKVKEQRSLEHTAPPTLASQRSKRHPRMPPSERYTAPPSRPEAPVTFVPDKVNRPPCEWAKPPEPDARASTATELAMVRSESIVATAGSCWVDGEREAEGSER